MFSPTPPKKNPKKPKTKKQQQQKNPQTLKWSKWTLRGYEYVEENKGIIFSQYELKNMKNITI